MLADLVAAGLAQYLWLAESRGWRGTAAYRDAHIVQGPGEIIFGVGVDSDTTTADDFGSWTLGEAPEIAVLSTVVRPLGDLGIGYAVKQLQQQLRAAGLYNGAIDGIPGPQTIAALQRYAD